MNFRLLRCTCILLLLTFKSFSQCPPPGFPEPGNTCPEAPILCPNLDGYCATINNNNIQMPFACCGASWVLNNDEWFGFFAGTTNITLEIVPQNCTDGPMKGLQGGIYADCPINNNGGDWCSLNMMAAQCNCTEDPFILSSGSFVVGQVYWIVLDGCSGNVCDYTIHVLEGSTVGFAPPNPAFISGAASACQGSSSEYTADLAQGATQYHWSISPVGAGTLSAEGNAVTVNWSADFSGAAELCVETSNQCYTSSGSTCFNISVQEQHFVSLSSSGALCAGSADSVDILINFTGNPPWNFSYALNGINQGNFSTQISPFLLPVNAPGMYTVSLLDSCAPPPAILELVEEPCGCAKETFLKILNHPNNDVHGYSIIDSKDGNIYLSGMKLDSVMIVKMTPSGQIIRTHTFDVKQDDLDKVTEIIVDNEGMIVGCGYSEAADSTAFGFVFRLNPATNTLQWLNSFQLESSQVSGLVALPDGQYLVYDTQHKSAPDNRMMVINRTDGLIDLNHPLTQSIHLSEAESFNSALVHDGKLYGVGQYVNGFGADQARTAISRIDLATGNIDWTRLSHIAAGAPAMLTGTDLLIENQHIFTVGFGDDSGTDLGKSKGFLQKTDLDGNLIWLKKFETFSNVGSLRIHEIVSVPDGFILYTELWALGVQDFNLFMLKTDKDGNLLWTKRWNLASGEIPCQSQALYKDNNLYFIANTGVTFPIIHVQTSVAKTTMDITLEGDCNFIFPAVLFGSAVFNPANTLVSTQKVLVAELDKPLSQTAELTGMEVMDRCQVFYHDQLSLSLCAGESVQIGGFNYQQDTSFQIQIPGSNGCDTLRTYNIVFNPLQTRQEMISFCPGTVVTLDGINYTQPGTVMLIHPGGPDACDTMVTYILEFSTPAPSTVSLSCPNDINVEVPANSSGAVVNYTLPNASSDCVCPGIDMSLSSGLPSGSHFPTGISEVCYTAKDSCGQSASCCFEVTLEEMTDEGEACDTKINGCVKYELLTITEDAGKNRTYRIRVTNSCTNKLIYTAIQAPDGLVPMAPANFATYTAPSGNTYLVRNPNYSPQYSIRFSSVSDSIHNGESDIFKYTLPAQAQVTFIHVVSRLAPYVFVSAHLNTFYCPIGITPAGDRPSPEPSDLRNAELDKETGLLVFPNPATEQVQVFTGIAGQLQVLDGMGRVVYTGRMDESGTEFSVQDFPQGLYRVVFTGALHIQHQALSVQH